MENQEVRYYPAPDHAQNTLLDALGAVGADNSRRSREQIAAANGIPEYSGRPVQDWNLLQLLRAGRLKRGEEDVAATKD